MIKVLEPGRIAPHPTEWVVVAGTETSKYFEPGKIYYTKLAQFVHEHDAYNFAKTITCYHTSVIAPNPYNGVAVI